MILNHSKTIRSAISLLSISLCTCNYYILHRQLVIDQHLTHTLNLTHDVRNQYIREDKFQALVEGYTRMITISGGVMIVYTYPQMFTTD